MPSSRGTGVVSPSPNGPSTPQKTVVPSTPKKIVPSTPKKTVMPSTPAPGSEAQKKFHSMCRWNKPADELEAFIKENRGVENSIDQANGNRPIHIAAQNGHIEVVRLLIADKVMLNAANNAGNTALHMSRAYDYYWCGKLLVEAGAGEDVKNEAGFESGQGIDGDKRGDDAIPALISARDSKEISLALDMIAKQSDVDKGQLVMAGMGKKRSAKELWTASVDAQFKEICKSI